MVRQGVALQCSLYSNLHPRSRCMVKLKSALTFDFLLKIVLDSCPISCKITFTQLSVKVSVVEYSEEIDA